MTSYAEFETEDRRLVILRILLKLEDRRANQYVLRSALRANGYEEIVGTVSNDISFLARERLVTKEDLDSGVVMATLTDFGALVAKGLRRVVGVAAPAVD